jgi:hypothetical protein
LRAFRRRGFQLQLVSELTHSVINATPSASTFADPMIGMPYASRRLMRAINTERVALRRAR